MVPYEGFACPCGAGDVVLRESYKPKPVVNYTTHVHDQSLSKTPSDVKKFYKKKNESVYWLVLLELQRL
nr:hypothetical protein [Tanacetum cinerariifolium]